MIRTGVSLGKVRRLRWCASGYSPTTETRSRHAHFLIIIWGIMAFISVTGTLYIIINYEIQRWKDVARRPARISGESIRQRLF